jgi:hypothetical protein
MTDLAETDVAPVGRAKSRRRRVVAIGGSVVFLLAGLVVGVLIISHYRDAPSLANQGGDYGWGSPDNLASHFVELGPHQGLVAPMRAGHSQSFYINVDNDSSVTQTVLGLGHSSYPSDNQERVAISTGSDYRSGSFGATYIAGPVGIPPHSMRFLRYTIDIPKCPGVSDQYWDSLRVRVRVGAFTRTETINFENAIFELTVPKTSC